MRAFRVMASVAMISGCLVAQAHAGNDETGSGEVMAGRVLDLINAERARNGCAPLALNAQLSAAALRHSQDMARQHFFDHKDPDGTTPGQRVRETGYSFQMMGENIEAGTDTAEDAVRVWMNSPGHRANILTCAYRETGIAFVDDKDDVPMRGQSMPYEYYWTQEFALPVR